MMTTLSLLTHPYTSPIGVDHTLSLVPCGYTHNLAVINKGYGNDGPKGGLDAGEIWFSSTITAGRCGVPLYGAGRTFGSCSLSSMFDPVRSLLDVWMDAMDALPRYGDTDLAMPDTYCPIRMGAYGTTEYISGGSYSSFRRPLRILYSATSARCARHRFDSVDSAVSPSPYDTRHFISLSITRAKAAKRREYALYGTPARSLSSAVLGTP